LKGFIDKDLISGSASFEKIQIKEVTSHFRNGWIFFVVYPKLNSNSNNTVLIGNNGYIVNAQRVKPLILEKVVVKAKKAKESFADEAAEAAEEKEDQSREG
jgi:pyruvoyl-dependent arginine decarboxylase (PvlArgDC)